MSYSRANQLSSAHHRLIPAALMFVFTLLFLLLLQFFPSSLRAESPSESLAPIDSMLADHSQLDGKVVYVDFWASWCPPCRKSFPWMDELKQAHAQEGFEVVAVNLDKSRVPADTFLAELQSHLTVIYDSTGALAQQFHIEAMPTSFVFGRDGVLHGRYQGFRPQDTTAIDSLVASLLAAEAEE